ncbi:MAG: hypothetical protein WC045_02845 [Patescibacteria group bacterium]
MADLELVEYLRQNKSKYSISVLTRSLVDQGVEEEEITEALSVLEQEDREHVRGLIHDDEGVSNHEEIVDGGEVVRSRFDFLEDARAKSVVTKLDGILKAALKLIGVKKHDENSVSSVVSYGAIAFVMTTVIVTVFQYGAAQYVYPRVAEDAGVFGRLALPDIFLLSIHFGPLILSLLWALLLGAIGTFVFIRYLIRFWPFTLVSEFTLKLGLFYALIHIIFGVFFGGLIIKITGVYLVGYLIVTIGALGASYVAALYFVNSLQQKHPQILKDLLYKKW